jgi:hypothetical protein
LPALRHHAIGLDRRRHCPVGPHRRMGGDRLPADVTVRVSRDSLAAAMVLVLGALVFIAAMSLVVWLSATGH